MVKHGGFGSEAYAREELRAEIAAMMTGEQLGVGDEPRHGTAYDSSWIKARENDPKEIRAAAVDARRISDWLLAGERERSKCGERPAGADEARGREGPARSVAAPEAPGQSRAGQADVPRDLGRSQPANPPLAAGERPRDAGPTRLGPTSVVSRRPRRSCIMVLEDGTETGAR